MNTAEKEVKLNQKYIAWFSHGAPSTVAAKMAISEFGKDNVRVICQHLTTEHPDNERYFEEAERWLGVKIEKISSDKYIDTWDVYEKTGWLVGVGGARCTGELKRKVAESIINFGKGQEIEIFGYTAEEEHRVKRFIKNNPERKIYPILIERSLSKMDCLGMIDRAGIEVPEMYKMGYQNNNCIGCVKGQQGYWNKIRVDFPDVFERMSEVERKLDAAINKRYEGKNRIRVFLDELDPSAGNILTEPKVECGIICMGEHDLLND